MAWFEDNARDFHQREFEARSEIYQPLAKGQSPRALVITCADSRIDTKRLLKAEPGMIMEVRNAGNVVPPDSLLGETTTIEISVGMLGVEDLILMGHTGCAIAQQLLEDAENLVQYPAISNWREQLQKARQRVDQLEPELSGEDWVHRVVEENVALQLENVAGIPLVKKAVTEGKLKLHGWVYHVESGRVSRLDQQSGRFEPL